MDVNCGNEKAFLRKSTIASKGLLLLAKRKPCRLPMCVPIYIHMYGICMYKERTPLRIRETCIILHVSRDRCIDAEKFHDINSLIYAVRFNICPFSEISPFVCVSLYLLFRSAQLHHRYSANYIQFIFFFVYRESRWEKKFSALLWDLVDFLSCRYKRLWLIFIR